MAGLAQFSRWIAVVVIVLVFAGGPVAAQDQAASFSATEVETWVRQLASPSYEEREAATARLIAAGPRAVAAVTNAAQTGGPEAVWRSVSILETIGSNGSEKTLEKVVVSMQLLAKAGNKRAGELGASLQQQWRLNRHKTAILELRKLGAEVNLPELTAQSWSGYPPDMIPGASFGSPYGRPTEGIWYGSGYGGGTIDMSGTFTIDESISFPIEVYSELDRLELPLVPLEEEEEEFVEPIAEPTDEAVAPPIEDPEFGDDASFKVEPFKGEAPELESTDFRDLSKRMEEVARKLEETEVFEAGDVIEKVGDVPVGAIEIIEELEALVTESRPVYEIAPVISGGFMPVGGLAPQQPGTVRIGSDWKGSVDGLRYLRDLLNVNQVEMNEFDLNETALIHLTAMPDLQVLTLNQCTFQQADVARFRKAKPGVDVRAFNQAVLGISGPPEQKPFVISHVQPQTGAAEAGLKPGDVIRSIDGEPIGDFSGLTFHIAGRKVGDELAIEFQREGKTMIRKAKLGDRSKIEQ